MTVHAEVVAKLHPDHVRVSGKFTALLAFLLDEIWTDPPILGLTITSDGWLLGGEIFADDLLGNVADLEDNVRGVALVAGLSAEETTWLLAQIPLRAHDWRRGPSSI